MTEAILHALEATIVNRLKTGDETSHSRKLAEKGLSAVAQKLGEEAVETIIAALAEDREALIREGADLLYHFLLLLAVKDVRLAEVTAELARRTGRSGLAEKAARSPSGQAQKASP